MWCHYSIRNTVALQACASLPSSEKLRCRNRAGGRGTEALKGPLLCVLSYPTQVSQALPRCRVAVSFQLKSYDSDESSGSGSSKC
jgi:hypothetical protein